MAGDFPSGGGGPAAQAARVLARPRRGAVRGAPRGPRHARRARPAGARPADHPAGAEELLLSMQLHANAQHRQQQFAGLSLQRGGEEVHAICHKVCTFLSITSHMN